MIRKRNRRKIEQADSPRGMFGMKGTADAKHGLLGMKKEKEKGFIDKLLGKLENLMSIENTEKRVGILQKVLTMLDNFKLLDKKQQKRFKKLSVPRSIRNIKDMFTR